MPTERRTSSCRALLRVACAGALASPACAQVFPDPANCALYVSAVVDDILTTAYGICSAVADCTLPGLDEISCASDITSMFSSTFDVGMRISFATLSCGSLDNVCASDIMGALTDFSDFTTELIAAFSDCPANAWVCSYDIINAVDLMDFFLTDVIGTFTDCDQEKVRQRRYSFAAWLAWNNGIYSRRLQAAPAPASAAGFEAGSVGSPPVFTRAAEELHAEVRDVLRDFSGVLDRRRAAPPPASNATGLGGFAGEVSSLREAKLILSRIAPGLRAAMHAMLPPSLGAAGGAVRAPGLRAAMRAMLPPPPVASGDAARSPVVV